MQQPQVGQAAENIELLRQAVARNPGDLDVGLMLGSALHGVGEYVESAVALKNVLKQHPDHPYTLLLLARSLARSGNIAEALEALAKAQKIDPTDPQAWQVGAALAAQIRDWPELLHIALSWTEFHPQALEAWQALSRAHFEESRFEEAIAAFEHVLKLAPNNPSHLVSAARLHIAATNYDSARQLLDAAHQLAPSSGELLYTLSRLYHMTGELAAAEDYCRRAIAVLPKFAPAYVALGTLCEGQLQNLEIQIITQLFQDKTTHPEYRAMLGFTLGEALDRKGEYGQAFIAWEHANHINAMISEREGFLYQAKQFENDVQILAELFAEPLASPPTPPATEKMRPIFVVGMPRSCTTLVESILASHSTVYGAGELPTLYDIYEELLTVARVQGVSAARDLLCHNASAWRDRYLAALPQAGDAICVVDKQPLNFRAVGLIRMLFPESPIIYTQRSPLDIGLSIYRHKFAKDWPCAHRLADIGHYYGVHARMMSLWLERHPESIHVVDHAVLVEDTDAQIRHLLDFAKLVFEPACLSPHKTKRHVATFSSVQVQRPLSAAYSHRSSPYTAQLAPLRQALLNAGVNVPPENAH